MESLPVAARTRSRFLRIEKSASGFTTPGILNGCVGIVADRRDAETVTLAESMVALLVAQGIRAVRIEESDQEQSVTALVLLHGLRTLASGAAANEAAGCHKVAFQALRSLRPLLTGSGGSVVIVQDSVGSPWGAGLSALAKTAAQEWQDILATGRAIDIDRRGLTHEEIAERLVTELLRGGDEPEIFLSGDGKRVTIATISADAPNGPEPLPLAEGDVVLVTGGARGITAACLIELARSVRLRFALIGRTPQESEPPGLAEATTEAALVRSLLSGSGDKPDLAAAKQKAGQILANREITDTLRQLARLGSEALYCVADIQDQAAMNAVASDIRDRWGGTIHGVVHAAGVLADRRIMDKTDAQFDRVFDTKVHGLSAVLSAVNTDPLKCLVFFSSVAGRFGNIGQCDYAMANETLNVVASAEAARRGAGCVVKSLVWGPWDSGMVTAGLRDQFAKRGIALLSTADGARLFVEELSRSDKEPVVLLGAPLTPVEETTVPESRTFALLLSKKEYGVLEDHAVRGVPVLPVALVVEWFARVVGEAYPGHRLRRLENLAVLRGMPLPQFGSGIGTPLFVRLETKGDVLHFELRDGSDRLRYRARGFLSPGFAPIPRIEAPADAVPWLFPAEAAYTEDRLFHGESFRVLTELDAVCEQGGTARLVGVRDKGWHGEWTIDLAAFDGGLQLPVLWGHVTGEGESLPTHIGFIEIGDAPSDGVFQAGFRVARQTGGMCADITLYDDAGGLIFALGDAVMTVLPRSKPVNKGVS